MVALWVALLPAYTPVSTTVVSEGFCAQPFISRLLTENAPFRLVMTAEPAVWKASLVST